MSSANARPKYDAVVIGAGLVGLACAWRLAQTGRAVCVIERERVGAGASGVAAGMLAPVTEAEFGASRLTAANVAAARDYPAFVAELEAATGMHTGYEPCGTLVIATDRDELELLVRLSELQSSLGLDAQRLTSRQAREQEPALSPRVTGAIDAPADHQVRPRALMAALESAARAASVMFEFARVSKLTLAAGTVDGVQLEDGREIEASEVVVAAGPWSTELAGLDLGIAVRPVKGQILRLAGDRLIDKVLRSPEVYLVPRRDGTIVVGATVEEQGFDTVVTAGGVLELLRRGYELVPGLEELELRETAAGLRPATASNEPVIGRAGPDGVILATGHWRNGVLLAPSTAAAVAAIADGREVPLELRHFQPEIGARR